MPRASSSSLAIVTPTTVLSRVKPPRKLSAAEAKHWTAAVDSLPASFFGAEHAQQLGAYVRHAALADAMAGRLLDVDPAAVEWMRINAALIQHSRAALAYARSLRLTLSARADRDAAASAAKKRGPATLEQLRERYAQDDED